jgi:hypothetical protein
MPTFSCWFSTHEGDRGDKNRGGGREIKGERGGWFVLVLCLAHSHTLTHTTPVAIGTANAELDGGKEKGEKEEGVRGKGEDPPCEKRVGCAGTPSSVRSIAETAPHCSTAFAFVHRAIRSSRPLYLQYDVITRTVTRFMVSTPGRCVWTEC